MYNIIKLKFTVIASFGANTVILSSKQYLIHRKTEYDSSCDGTGLDSKSKKLNNNHQKKNPNQPQTTKLQDILS